MVGCSIVNSLRPVSLGGTAGTLQRTARLRALRKKLGPASVGFGPILSQYHRGNGEGLGGQEGNMATYEKIQKWIRENYGYTVKSCWIAHVKEMCGLNPRAAP